jgi:glycosyltransferase involved in cell wall biosynthesis
VNILLLNAVKGWSGIGSYTIELALALRRRGHKVLIGCSSEINVIRRARDLSLPVRKIKLRNLADIRGILMIITAVLREDIDVIVSNLGKEYWPATLVAKLTGRKIIIVRHQTNRPKNITLRLLSRHVDRVVAVSRAVKGVLEAGGVPAQKIDVVHGAVGLDRFDPFSVDRESARRALGTSGRLEGKKGGLWLIRAAHRILPEHASLKVLFAGDGDYRGELEKEAERLAIKGSVIFAGFRQDMENVCAAVDIFVLPSACIEAFGLSLVEAMAMTRPAIATSVGGVPEIITDGVNGLLVPPRDDVALAAALTRLLDDPAFAASIAREGRLTVERHFSGSLLGEDFERSLLRVAGKTQERGCSF